MVLTAPVQAFVSLVLIWIGYGTVTALLAQMFLPGNHPKSFFGYLVVGIAGSCAGPVAFAEFLKPDEFHPLSPAGFALAVASAIVLLLFYRVIVFLGTAAVKDEKQPQVNEPEQVKVDV
jgi:uncharacterized membrane protein YeaQ/YmgE (transglycosylase-associated protein family)